MRIWDIPVDRLCDKHLLAEHRELHAIWIYITTEKGHNYRKHPETLRWYGKQPALRARHMQQVIEMKHRGWNHDSPLPDAGFQIGKRTQDMFVHSIKEQIAILKTKGCKCKV